MIWTYLVRPADPGHRADAPEAHEVVAEADGRPQRVVGVWRTENSALAIAVALTRQAEEQLR